MELDGVWWIYLSVDLSMWISEFECFTWERVLNVVVAVAVVAAVHVVITVFDVAGIPGNPK